MITFGERECVWFAGEVVVLCFGLYLCHCVRGAPSEFKETHLITAAISIELIFTSIFYVIRFVYTFFSDVMGLLSIG